MKKEEQSRLYAFFRRNFLAVIFSLCLVLITKIFLISSYHVPTASMASTIIPGDHILVEKYIFGTRIFIKNHCYRIPGFRKIRQGDILVFNVPKEDSIFLSKTDINYYDWKTNHLKEVSLAPPPKDSIRFIPVRYRTPFVKRVLGLPGDTIRYTGSQIKVNRLMLPFFPDAEQEYKIFFSDQVTFDRWKNKLYRRGQQVQMDHSSHTISGIFRSGDLRELPADKTELRTATRLPGPATIPGEFGWAGCLADSRSSLVVPFKGQTFSVTPDFVKCYGNLIKRFEAFPGKVHSQNILDESGLQLDAYTFRQNYYWCLGDNRPFSVDSRYWSLVPEDHIIGVSRRILWSRDVATDSKKEIRWNRVLHKLQ